MSLSRPLSGHAGFRARWVTVLAVLLVMSCVLIFVDHGAFRQFARSAGSGGVLPDTTLDFDPSGGMPVITSVRSDGAAERAGLQAGDDIEAIDGHAVRSVADLRAVVLAAQDDAPLALRVLRGDTTRTVLLVRGTRDIASGLGNGAENSAD
jgi:C-terminal processing protease CtpA/Prc